MAGEYDTNVADPSTCSGGADPPSTPPSLPTTGGGGGGGGADPPSTPPSQPTSGGGGGGGGAEPAPPPPSQPTNGGGGGGGGSDSSVEIALTASGDVADYTQSVRTSILEVLAFAAGLTSSDSDPAPSGSELTVTAGSVNLVATFPVADEAAASAAVSAASSNLADAGAINTLMSNKGITAVTAESGATAEVEEESPPPPPPPPPVPISCSTCEYYIDGASASNEPGALCLKMEARGNVCRPRHGSRCDAGMTACRNGPVGTSCSDAAGTWANKKCARKVRKNKCHKRRVRKHCHASCGLC